jgi:hypothetical protein
MLRNGRHRRIIPPCRPHGGPRPEDKPMKRMMGLLLLTLALGTITVQPSRK